MVVTGGQVTIRTRKLFSNMLLKRKEMRVEIIHPGLPLPDKKTVSEELAKLFQSASDRIFCFEFKTSFGGGKSLGKAYVYDTIDAARKFEPKHRLIRKGLVQPTKKKSRKVRKSRRRKLNKLKGTKKATVSKND